MNASEPRKATDADAREDDTPIAPRPHSEPLSTIEAYLQGQHGPPHPEVVRILEREAAAPEPVGPSMARVEAAARAVNDALAGYDVHDAGVSATYKIAVAALAAADAVEVAPDGHAALVERLREGLAASEHMRSVQKIDRTAQAFDRLRADNDALRGECDEAIEQAERHAEDVATAEREVSALWVTVAERDVSLKREHTWRMEAEAEVAERDATIKRVRVAASAGVFEVVALEWVNGYTHLAAQILAALDGPDDRSGGQS